MKIAKNVELLEIKGENGNLYPVLTWDEKELVLIDTALPGQTDLLKQAVEQASFKFEKITKVILTHQDMDHIGSAKTLAGLGAEILAHQDEAPYIQGDLTFVKLTDLESRFATLSQGELVFYERMKRGAPHFWVHIDRLLLDGEMLDFCGGIQVLHTPGHTPGHIALFLKQSNILVAGDAANIFAGALVGADPNYTHDMARADISFVKLTACNPDFVVCCHGGLLEME